MENQTYQAEIFELQVLDQQIRQFEQQLMMIEQQILEQDLISHELDQFKKAKKGDDMLFPFSRNIFVMGKVENTERVLVNIGSKVLAEKSIEDAKKTIDKTKERLFAASDELKGEMEKMISRISEIEHKVSCDNPEHHH